MNNLSKCDKQYLHFMDQHKIDTDNNIISGERF